VKNNTTIRSAIALVGIVSLLAGFGTASANAVPAKQRVKTHSVRACSPNATGFNATCFAQVQVVDQTGLVANPMSSTAAAANTGLTPANIRAAYNLTRFSSGGRTVAIVDAYAYPNAAADLAVYRSTYGLPPCTVASGCLTILNQNGGTTPPPTVDIGWDTEQALDLDAVSAACPDCKILLVQANTSSLINLGIAVNTAASRPGVIAISNSYGTGADLSDSAWTGTTTIGSYYNHPTIAVTASTGDNGNTGPSYPATSLYTVAVGGTTLLPAANARGWSETVWSGAGSGCSTQVARPPWQTSYPGCATGRASADISAVADPNNGLIIYGPVGNSSTPVWLYAGGTSLSSPLIASMYALNSKNAGGLTYTGAGTHAAAEYIYQAPATAINDVTSGNNGACGTALCTADVGWDGPTGRGTPRGVAALGAPYVP